MDLVHPLFIENTLRQIYGDNIVSFATSVSYFQILLSPFADQLVNLTTKQIMKEINDIFGDLSVNYILEWVSGKFPDTLGDLIINNTRLSELDTKDYVNYRVIQLLIELVCIDSEQVEDTVLLPWDIKQDINRSENLINAFITEDDNLLPVDVIIQQYQHSYTMSPEFAYGLRIFSRASGINLPLSMFKSHALDKEIDLSTRYKTMNYRKYIVGQTPFRSPTRRILSPLAQTQTQTQTYFYKYSVDIYIDGNTSTYYTDTKDFMHGLITGALWANIDHHRYWGNLKDYTINPMGVQITF